MPPSRIWWTGLWDTAFGIPSFRYYERVEVGVLYRGYLQFSGEIDGIHAYYEGYLYPEGEPYPIPSRDKPEIQERNDGMSKKMKKIMSTMLMVTILSILLPINPVLSHEEFDIDGIYMTDEDSAIKGYIFSEEVVLLLNDLDSYTTETTNRKLVTDDLGAYLTNNNQLTKLSDPTKNNDTSEDRPTIEYVDEESNEKYEEYALHVFIITNPTYRYSENNGSWTLRVGDQRINSLEFSEDFSEVVDEFDVMYKLTEDKETDKNN